MNTTTVNGIAVKTASARTEPNLTRGWSVTARTTAGTKIVIDWFTTSAAAERFAEALRAANDDTTTDELRDAAGVTRHE